MTHWERLSQQYPDFPAHLRELYARHGIRYLAHRFGVSRCTMTTYLRKAGLTLRGRGGCQVVPKVGIGTAADIRALVDEFGATSVARSMGVSRSTIYKQWYKFGAKKGREDAE